MDWLLNNFDACLLALAQGACWVETLFLISTCTPFVAPLFIRCFCCALACLQISDNYTTDTIADYDQRSGTWTVGSGTLNCSDATGLIIHNTAMRDDIGSVSVSVAGVGSVGEIVRLVGAYVDDDNYLAAEYELTNAAITQWTVRLYERVAAVETLLQENTTVVVGIAGSYLLRLCWDGEYAGARITGSSGNNIFAATSLVGNKAGIEIVNNTGTLNFDAFRVNDAFDNLPTLCEECDGHCASQCIGSTSSIQIQVDISGVADGTCGTDCSANVNGTHIATLGQTNGSITCAWQGDFGTLGGCNSVFDLTFLTTSIRFTFASGTCIIDKTGLSANRDCSSAQTLTEDNACAGCDITGISIAITPL